MVPVTVRGALSRIGVESIHSDTFPPFARYYMSRCLLVEDQPEISFIVRRFTQGFTSLDMASNAEEAIPLLQTSTYDLLIIDIQLGPGISGIELLHAIRANARYAAVPAIAFTAATEKGNREKILAHGFDDFLAKPFTRKDVVEVVTKYLPVPAVEPQHVAGTR